MIQFAFFAFLAAAVIAYLVLHDRLFARVKQRHAAIWEGLGKPSFLDTAPPGESLRVLRFVLQRQYAQANDPVLNELGKWTLVLLGVSGVLFVANILFFLYGWLF